MAENSNIEWTDNTWNPWMGCTAVSPACDNCYAERLVNRFGDFAKRKRTSPENWKKPYRWNRAAQKQGVRLKVFCLSLGDFFDNRVPSEWRIDAWKVIQETPNLDWQILTKRPQNIKKFLPLDWGNGYENVWLGITAEDGERYRQRYPYLANIPAALRFISNEPALGGFLINLICPEVIKPDWIICGGESAKGPHRPMDLEWARSMRDQCQEHGIAFFMKQIDKKQPIPNDLMVREFPQ